MCQIIIAAKVAAIKPSALRIVVLDERNLVLPVRIELTTSPLPRECSTTELRQHARCRESGQ
jgi:hypothetical protein